MGILVDKLLAAVVSVSPMVLDVPCVCPYAYVHTSMCALKLDTCCPLLLVGAKACMSSDECKLRDENDSHPQPRKKGEKKRICGYSQDQLRNSFRLTEGNDDGAEFPPEKSTSACTKTPFTVWTQ